LLVSGWFGACVVRCGSSYQRWSDVWYTSFGPSCVHIWWRCMVEDHRPMTPRKISLRNEQCGEDAGHRQRQEVRCRQRPVGRCDDVSNADVCCRCDEDDDAVTAMGDDAGNARAQTEVYGKSVYDRGEKSVCDKESQANIARAYQTRAWEGGISFNLGKRAVNSSSAGDRGQSTCFRWPAKRAKATKS
jgi:hypothetical protein